MMARIERGVEDWEYDFIRGLTAPWYIRQAIEMAHLCRMRKVEILTARQNQVLEQGFDTLRRKGSRDAITLWSDRLRAAVNAAKDYPRKANSIYLFADHYGHPIKESTFDTAWQRLMAKAKKRNPEFVPFTFHDLKSKGVSDFVGEKKRASGHKTDAMVARYDRKKMEVNPTR